MISFPPLPAPLREIKTQYRVIPDYTKSGAGGNIDQSVVDTFGEEWLKFHEFDEQELIEMGNTYFDILTSGMINSNTYAIDFGCGTGRWSRYLQNKVQRIEAIDPSNAVLAADKLLESIPNVRVIKAAIEDVPFLDETFDFGMSIGVLHHIPNTQKAMQDCVQKIKKGGYFYVYLYYALDGRGVIFKSLFYLSNIVRRIIAWLPSLPKKIVCDLIALLVYWPLATIGKIVRQIGLKRLSQMIPLAAYQDRSFFVMRNDALDRFGTQLEQRFTKSEVLLMMEQSGLSEIIVSDKIPYWHAVGKRIR